MKIFGKIHQWGEKHATEQCTPVKISQRQNKYSCSINVIKKKKDE